MESKVVVDKNLIDPVDEPDAERAHRAVKTALSAIPGLGGPAVELFTGLIVSPMERRKKAWMIQVSDTIQELYDKKILTEKDLHENEIFLTSLVTASGIAIKNHQAEKLEALRNAVINSALPGAPDETVQRLFLNFVDTCTLWHLALLRLFRDPRHWAKEKNHQFPNLTAGGLTDIIESAYPEMRGREDICKIVWQELYRYNFVSSDSLSGMMSSSGLLAKRTTELGDQFLDFTAKPNI